MKILDTTLFYTQASGGVRTYVDAKRRALLRIEPEVLDPRVRRRLLAGAWVDQALRMRQR